MREFTKLSFCESTVTDFVFGASQRAEHLTGKPIFPTGASESELASTFIAEALRVGVLRTAPLA